MTLSPFAPRVKAPEPHLAGYLRLTRKQWDPTTSAYGEGVFWVKAADVQVVEPWFDGEGSFLGSVLSMAGGRQVHTRVSVDAVMALLSTLEGSRG